MLRPRKRYTVHDLRQLKGKRCLTHIHVKSPEEAAAAEQAGVDLMSCSFDSPEAQARLPLLVAAAPTSFLSAATPHGLASPEEAIRVAFRALEAGASSVYCSASPSIIEAMAREGVVGIRFSLNRYPDLPDFTSPAYRRFFDRLGALDLFVHLFVKVRRKLL